MATGFDFPTFFDRFEDLRRRLRRQLGRQTMTILAICLLMELAMIAWLDFRFELPWTVRAVSLTIASMAAVLLSIWLLVTGIRSLTRFRTASAIENRFPELGQRVRTTIEFRSRTTEELQSAGIAPGLVRALETQAAVSTLPLPLEHLIPVRRLIVLTVIAAMIFGFLAGTCIWNTDWRTAMRRALLADEPFTHVVLETEDSIVDRGTSLTLRAMQYGRVRESVVLRTRPVNRDSDTWDVQTFAVDDAESVGPYGIIYESTIPNITDPIEFQWAAGPEQSAIHRIEVRYPLNIASIKVTVTPPEYMGLPQSVNTDGNLNVPEGSLARFEIELDGRPASAKISFKPTSQSKFDDAEVRSIDPAVEGDKLRFETILESDESWQVEATSLQGLPLAANSHRIRVRKDQPPSVSFEEPYDGLDVHSLAEILMRIRASDDLGLTRAGIVFQINNDEEHTLYAEDFSKVSDDLRGQPKPTPITTASLERTLPLEYFHLIQKDSITYYAFAEDNRPDATQRTETELRFIDIRPFKITYRERPREEPGENSGGGPRRATFEELIGRQRAALNRTLVMKRSTKQDLPGLDRLMKYEGETAELTHDLGAFITAQSEQFNIPALLDNAELLFQAERAMLESIDSMSVGKYDVAMLQEKDAVRFLVESRDRLEEFLDDKSTPRELRNAINSYFRNQMKLRRKPAQNQDAKQKAENLISQIGQLAAEEAMVAAELGMFGNNEKQSDEQMATGGTEKIESEKENSTHGQGFAVDPSSKEEDQTGEGEKVVRAEIPKTSTPRTGRSRDELAKRQQEIASLSSEVQTELGQMRDATELAKQRMAAATQAAEAASSALQHGSSKAATGLADDAAERYEQLASLVRGLLATELSDKLGAARDLADEISRQEEDLAKSNQPTNGNKDYGTNSKNKNEFREKLAEKTEKLAALGDSVTDILNNVMRSKVPSEQKSLAKVSELLEKEGLANTVERLKQQAGGIRAGRIEDERKAAAEIAHEFDVAARKLDSLQREIMNPKIAELLQLEAKAEELEAKLDDVETKRQAEQWHAAADELLDEIESVGGLAQPEEELRDQMKEFGWSVESRQLRGPAAADYQLQKYNKTLKGIAGDLRERIRLLLIEELTTVGEELPPLQYEAMVGKYQKALTIGPKGTKVRPRRAKDREMNDD